MFFFLVTVHQKRKTDEKKVHFHSIFFRWSHQTNRNFILWLQTLQFQWLPLFNCTGITKISFDFKVKKMTVVGDNFDVLSAGTKLNGLCRTELVSFGQAKEPEEGEHDKAESNEANKKEERKLPISFLSRMWLGSSSILKMNTFFDRMPAVQ